MDPVKRFFALNERQKNDLLREYLGMHRFGQTEERTNKPAYSMNHQAFQPVAPLPQNSFMNLSTNSFTTAGLAPFEEMAQPSVSSQMPTALPYEPAYNFRNVSSSSQEPFPMISATQHLSARSDDSLGRQWITSTSAFPEELKQLALFSQNEPELPRPVTAPLPVHYVRASAPSMSPILVPNVPGPSQEHLNEPAVRPHVNLSSSSMTSPSTSIQAPRALPTKHKKSTSHPFRRHVCELCSKGFCSPSALMRHKRTHTGETPFSCSICVRSFKQKGTLDSHMRVHTGEMPFACDEPAGCGMRFRHRSSMKRHIKRCPVLKAAASSTNPS